MTLSTCMDNQSTWDHPKLRGMHNYSISSHDLGPKDHHFGLLAVGALSAGPIPAILRAGPCGPHVRLKTPDLASEIMTFGECPFKPPCRGFAKMAVKRKGEPQMACPGFIMERTHLVFPPDASSRIFLSQSATRDRGFKN